MARILLIDADDSVRCAMRCILEMRDHTVIEARDGAEGLEMLPHVDPDLLITDLATPRIGGLVVLKEVREKFSPVKSIAMSAGGRWGRTSELDEARRAGAAKVLAKPFSVRELMAAVDDLLTGARAASRDLAR